MTWWLPMLSLSFIAAVFFLPASTADQCEIILLRRCKAGYKEALGDTSNGKEGHCIRLQGMVTCLSGVTDCHGQLIDNFRYWMLQMAMMDKILEVCPNMQYGGLKNIVRNTKVAKAHRYIDDVEKDLFEECAVTVHRQCVRYYVTVIMKDHQICQDAEKLNKCYDLTSKKINCEAKIIEHYSRMVEDVAHKVISLLTSHMKYLCS